jgi:adenylate cyclase
MTSAMQDQKETAAGALSDLLYDAERDAERTIGWVRIAVGLTLSAGLFMTATWLSAEEDPDFRARFNLAALTIVGFLALGFASVIASARRFYRPWLAYAFAASDALLVSANVWLTLFTRELSGDWSAALPVVLAAPLLLSVGALRFRAAVQVWATTCFIGGLAAAAGTRGLDALSSHGSAAIPALVPAGVVPFFTAPANAMRMIILFLIGATTAYVMIRARRLLVRASAEAAHRASLARFLPHDIAPLMAPGAGTIWRTGRRQRAAIMFVDMRGSTQIAEEMDPAQLSVFVSAFRRRITRATKAFPGVIDKFIGDGALIVFGIPEPRADDAERAVRCGREILRLVDIWNKKRGFDPPVKVGIGIHAGDAFCGIVGDEERLEFTVLGDTVNVAARIEQATKEFSEPLLVSEAILEDIGGTAQWREVARTPLRGRLHPIGIFAPREITPEKGRGA